MRDPGRIDVVLQALRGTWQRNPDLRLGQIVVGALRPKEPCPEIFYAEDEALLEALEAYEDRARQRS